jgi:hypothetical protein
LGFANALPSDEVVPNVSRANADDSLIVFSPRCCYLCQCLYSIEPCVVLCQALRCQ